MHRRDLPSPPPFSEDVRATQAEVVGFLRARLTKELAALWERELRRPPGWTGPGLAAQIEAVDSMLRLLDAGRLPSPLERRLLLHAYSTHPDHDPAWSTWP